METNNFAFIHHCDREAGREQLIAPGNKIANLNFVNQSVKEVNALNGNSSISNATNGLTPSYGNVYDTQLNATNNYNQPTNYNYYSYGQGTKSNFRSKFGMR